MTGPAILVHPPLPMFESQLAAYDVVHWPTDRSDVVAAITVGHIGIPNTALDALPNLRAIVCFGVGVDGLDLDYCRTRGIDVTHTREINHEDVADVAIGLIIAVARRFSDGERVLRAGQWRPPLAVAPQRRLRGMKLGIIGLGAIGRALADRALPFGLEIAWTGPRRKDDAPWRYESDLLALARWADILAVCARGDRSTEGMIDGRVLGAIGDDGILINVSRGAVVDEDALIVALKSGQLGGAGLDVFADEPTSPQRWADVPNVTLTPHLGGGTREALIQSAANVLENLRRATAGEPLLTPLP